MKRLTGRQLAVDLAEQLAATGEWLTFVEIELPGTEGDGNGNGRADVVTVRNHSYARQELRVYEVKVSKADFDRDVRQLKYRRYFGVAHRLFFAMPTGLVKKADVPDDAGLILRGDNGWHVTRAARPQTPEHLSVSTILALLYRQSEEPEDRRLARLEQVQRLYAEGGARSVARLAGHDVARRLHAERPVMERFLQELHDALTSIMGKQPTTSDVDELRRTLDAITKVSALRERHGEVMRKMGRYLANLGGRLPWLDQLETSLAEVEDVMKE